MNCAQWQNVVDIEAYLERLWTEILDPDRPVRRNDNFFSLGGHSMLAMLLLARIRDELEIELPVRSLFQVPVLSAFAALMAQALGIRG
jgi:aryl carrier-like protein